MMICQSCGMPMARYEDKGTDKFDNKSEDYCKFCFQKGKFTDEGISMEEKIEKNVQIAISKGMNEKAARDLAKNTLPKLRRWDTENF